METIKVGSRGSRLALVQVEEVKSLLKGAGIEVQFDGRTFQTGGDTDKSTPLDQANVADNFFTDTIDQALLNRDIDIAIHSAKDLPQELSQGISILALTKAMDETDAFVGRVPFSDLPKGAKVGTSSTLRKKEVAALNPDVELVNIRGPIEERIAMVDDGTCDGVIIATVALKRLGLEDRITDIMPWPAAPLQGQLAIAGRSLDYRLRKIFAPIDCRLNYGDVTLVGAGPGDPDLITVKGIKALQDADIVLYDYLAHPSLIQHAPQAKCISVGKRKGKHSLPQAELSRMILDHVRQGKNVVRLKGGDPFIFGRGAEELSYLKSFHVQVNVIPGVSSATGIPSVLGIPLTARDISSSVAFVSGHGKDEHDNQPQSIKIPDTDTIVFLMGLTKLEAIVKTLLETGRDKTMPVAVISNGTRDDQQMVIAPLTSIVEKVKAENIHQPALIIAGNIVNFKKDWMKKAAILYTGTNPRHYQTLGNIIHFPMIAITEKELKAEELNAMTHTFQKADMVLFTSRFAVKHFINLLHSDVLREDLQGKTTAVIGHETRRELLRYGIIPTVTAQQETSQGVLKSIEDHYDVKGKTLLFPRSSLSNPFLKDELTKKGAVVEEYCVYENTKPAQRSLPEQDVDTVIFSSPSTAKNFLDDYKNIPKEWIILSRGDKTQKFLKEKGYDSIALY